jgi:hypothetical protein
LSEAFIVIFLDFFLGRDCPLGTHHAGRDVDHFTLHIYASIAEQERKMIAERVKAAAEIAKSQGKKFGLQLRSKAWQRKVSAMGRAAIVREANERAQPYRVYVEWTLRNQAAMAGRSVSPRRRKDSTRPA